MNGGDNMVQFKTKADLGNAVRKARNEKGMSQSAVSAAIGVSLVAYQRYENGTSMPKPENLNKLIRVLGIE